MHMRKYSLEIINNALSNPTGTTFMPGIIFYALTSNVDNMRILYDLMQMGWVHPKTSETLDLYAQKNYECSLDYINWLKNPSSIPTNTPQNIIDQVREAQDSYEDDKIIDHTKDFIVICGVVLAGICTVECYNAAHDYWYDCN